MSRDTLEMAGITMEVDVTDLQAAIPSKERILLSCPTCKRGLALLGSGTIVIEEATVNAVCVRCVKQDARYRAEVGKEGSSNA